MGGAISDKSNVVISQSNFVVNNAQLGGVIFAGLDSKITIANATITGTGFGNISSGAIVYAKTGSILIMNNAVISDNSAANSKGFIFLHDSSLITYRFVCRNNLA